MKTFLKTVLPILILLPAYLCGEKGGNGFPSPGAVYSPRLTALGGAYASIGGDIASMYINPAGLAWLGRGEITFNYGDYPSDLKGGWLGFAYPLQDNISIGSGILYFDYGSFAEADRFGDLTGNTFAARDVALSGSIAGYLNRSFAWGLTLKYANSQIDPSSVSGLAADVGILYRAVFLNNLVAGITVRNLGKSPAAYYQMIESLPATLSFALTKHFTFYPVTVHAGWNNLPLNNSGAKNSISNFSIGFEIAALQPVTLRLGYRNNRQNELETASAANGSALSAGLGVQLGDHQLGYGYSDYGDLGATHHFGLTFRFGRKKNRPPPGEALYFTRSEQSDSLQDVRFSMDVDKLTISWEAVLGAAYNVYVRLEKSKDWSLINKTPRKKNYMTIKVPRIRGIYVFRVTCVFDHKEKFLSKEIRVNIE